MKNSTKKRVIYSEVIPSWDTMSPAQRIKAKRDFDLRKVSAFDSHLHGRGDNNKGASQKWERNLYDRARVDAEVSKTLDAPESRSKANMVDFDDESGFHTSEFQSTRKAQQSLFEDPDEAHEAAMFGNVSVGVAKPTQQKTVIQLPRTAQINYAAKELLQTSSCSEPSTKKIPKWKAKMLAKKETGQ
eukprot:m.118659 g.118659  ORF g.118659 m.118659 type:complete len:187 (+) comp28684_c0_seq1:400-960(+)